MNALSQPQNSQSSCGTMKNGTKIGPTSTATPVAAHPNEMTASRAARAPVRTTDDQVVADQVERVEERGLLHGQVQLGEAGVDLLGL